MKNPFFIKLLEMMKNWLLLKNTMSKVFFILSFIIVPIGLWWMLLQNGITIVFLEKPVDKLNEQLYNEDLVTYVNDTVEWMKYNIIGTYPNPAESNGWKAPSPLFTYRWNPFFVCFRPLGNDYMDWVYLTKCGHCGEHARFFKSIIQRSKVPVKVMSDTVIGHEWDEVLLNGEWVVVDTSRFMFNASRTEEFTAYMYIMAEYQNGTEVVETDRYNPTGILDIITESTEPVKIYLKNTAGTSKYTETHCTISRGEHCELHIGEYNYTIIGHSTGIFTRKDAMNAMVWYNKTTSVSINPSKVSYEAMLQDHTAFSIVVSFFLAPLSWIICGMIIVYLDWFKYLLKK